jgi:hypothetical protein
VASFQLASPFSIPEKLNEPEFAGVVLVNEFDGKNRGGFGDHPLSFLFSHTFAFDGETSYQGVLICFRDRIAVHFPIPRFYLY